MRQISYILCRPKSQWGEEEAEEVGNKGLDSWKLLNGHSIMKVLISSNSLVLKSHRQFISYIWTELVLILVVPHSNWKTLCTSSFTSLSLLSFSLFAKWYADSGSFGRNATPNPRSPLRSLGPSYLCRSTLDRPLCGKIAIWRLTFL